MNKQIIPDIPGMQYADSAIAFGHNVKWINVNESLPKRHENVLVFIPDNGWMYIAHFVGRKNKKILFDNSYWFGPTSKVTHWMPLPKPPQP